MIPKIEPNTFDFTQLALSKKSCIRLFCIDTDESVPFTSRVSFLSRKNGLKKNG